MVPVTDTVTAIIHRAFVDGVVAELRGLQRHEDLGASVAHHHGGHQGLAKAWEKRPENVGKPGGRGGKTWEEHGKIAKPWENHGKMGGNMGKPWENGKIMI